MPALEAALADPDPMVRGAALDLLLSAPLQQRVQLALGLVDDPSAIVRIKAGRALAIVPDQRGNVAINARLDKVFAEYVASQQANADRPDAHLNLGLFYFERRDAIKAEAEYRAAIALEPDFIPAYANLADLYQNYKREDEAESVLNAGLERAPDNADLTHALGLLRIRQGRTADALPMLARSAQLDSTNPRYAYVYGVALHDTGQAKKAMTVLEQALVRFPRSPEILSALVPYTREAGDTRRADEYAKRLNALVPQADASSPAQ